MAALPDGEKLSPTRAVLPAAKASGSLALAGYDQPVQAEPVADEANGTSEEPLPEIDVSIAVSAQEAAGAVIGLADFEAIYARYQQPITGYIYRMLGSPEQAADTMQDVFVKVYRAMANREEIQAGAFPNWLYRIATNTATDVLRRRRLREFIPLSVFAEDRGIGAGVREGTATRHIDDDMHGTSAEATNNFGVPYDGGLFEKNVAERELVQAVLNRLPPKYATVLNLFEIQGFSCTEIGETLGISPSAVKMRLMRARERFKTLYRAVSSGRIDVSDARQDVQEELVPETPAHLRAAGERSRHELPDLSGPPLSEAELLRILGVDAEQTPFDLPDEQPRTPARASRGKTAATNTPKPRRRETHAQSTANQYDAPLDEQTILQLIERLAAGEEVEHP